MAEAQNGAPEPSAATAAAEKKPDDRPSEFVIPPQPIRQDQVENAVNFLSHPKVKGSPVLYRRSFLERKGLSKEEIDEAFRRVPDPTTTTLPQTTTTTTTAAAAQAPPPLAPAPFPPHAISSAITAVPRKGARWSQLLLALGVLSAAGAGAALVSKNYVFPKLKAWIRHVVLDEDYKVKPMKAEPAVESDSSKLAAAAMELAAVSKELIAFKAEDRKHMEALIKSLEARDEQLKSTLDTFIQLQKSRPVSPVSNANANAYRGTVYQGSEDVKLSNGGLGKFYSNGPGALPVSNSATHVNRGFQYQGSEHVKLSNGGPGNIYSDLTPGFADGPSTAPATTSPSYMEVMAMLERGEKPPGIREVNDKPPVANQVPSTARLEPKPKPWERGPVQPSEPWWQKKEANAIKITEIEDERVPWQPPPVPRAKIPGVEAAIRPRPKSPAVGQSASYKYQDEDASSTPPSYLAGAVQDVTMNQTIAEVVQGVKSEESTNSSHHELKMNPEAGPQEVKVSSDYPGDVKMASMSSSYREEAKMSSSYPQDVQDVKVTSAQPVNGTGSYSDSEVKSELSFSESSGKQHLDEPMAEEFGGSSSGHGAEDKSVPEA